MPDVIAAGLAVLFVGINPGLYTAAIGHHFGRPGNRFWPALHAGGFTPRLFSPYEERELLPLGYGITNVVARATATADELTQAELLEGGRRLTAKARRYRPRILAFLGIGAYRVAFARPRATLGPAAGDDRLLPRVDPAESQRAQRPLPGRGPGAALPPAPRSRATLVTWREQRAAIPLVVP